jgi:hypothetical protein
MGGFGESASGVLRPGGGLEGQGTSSSEELGKEVILGPSYHSLRLPWLVLEVAAEWKERSIATPMLWGAPFSTSFGRNRGLAAPLCALLHSRSGGIEANRVTAFFHMRAVTTPVARVGSAKKAEPDLALMGRLIHPRRAARQRLTRERRVQVVDSYELAIARVEPRAESLVMPWQRLHEATQAVY